MFHRINIIFSEYHQLYNIVLNTESQNIFQFKLLFFSTEACLEKIFSFDYIPINKWKISCAVDEEIVERYARFSCIRQRPYFR